MSIFVLSMGLLSCFTIGLAITYLLYDSSAHHRLDKIFGMAFIVGIAIMSTFVNLLIGFGIPGKYPAIILTIMSFLSTGFIIWKERSKLVSSGKKISYWVRYLVIPALLIGGLGGYYLKARPTEWQGYWWCDIFFYGTQAEFLKNHGISQVAKFAESSPWLAATDVYFHGYHRTGRAALQAAIAAITGTDGPATMGFMVFGLAVVIYAGFLALSAEMGLPEPYRTLGAVTAAACPAVIITGFEGFIPTLLILILFLGCAVLIPELLHRPRWITVLALAPVITTIVTTMVEAAGVVCLMVIAALIITVIKKKFTLKGLYLLATAGVAAAVLALPYLAGLWTEVSEALKPGTIARRGLNEIYPQGDKPIILQYLQWGSIYKPESVTGALLGTISYLILATGLAGLIYLGMKHTQAMLLGCVALLVLFAMREPESQYVIVKNLHFSWPIFIFCSFVFIGIFIKKIQLSPKAWLSLNIATWLALSAITLVSGYKTAKTSRLLENPTTGYSSRINDLSVQFPAHDRAFYRSLESQTGPVVVLADPEAGMETWWTFYRLRNAHVWSMSPRMVKIFRPALTNSYLDLDKIPAEATLIYSPSYRNLGIPEKDLSDLGCVGESRLHDIWARFDTNVRKTDTVVLSCYAHKEAEITMDFTTASPGTATLGTQTYQLPGKVKIAIHPGAQRLEIKLNTALDLSGKITQVQLR